MSGKVEPTGALICVFVTYREEDALKEAYRNNPLVEARELGVDVSKWDVEIARATNRPQVDLTGAYTYRSDNTGDMFNARHSNFDMGFTVAIPLFDGFSSKAKVDAARARYRQVSLQKEDLKERIAVEVKQALLDLAQAQAIVASQKENVAVAQEALRIAEVRYENGEGTNLDVIDAQVSLAQIEKNLSEGIYDYLMAQASLDRTTGVLRGEEERDEEKD
jgi:outer membrane protein